MSDRDDIELLRKLPSVEHLAPRISLGGWMNTTAVTYGNKTGSFTVMGDYPALAKIVSFQYFAGRFINDAYIAESRKVVVIGQAVKEQLFGDEDAMGKYVKISGVYFQVIGITRTAARWRGYGIG